ncbi:lysophospholipase L1-like esterase [Duganella sp. 1224]|uniref:rhamnogalacturonan acetylesterase n=1 Tax=Duganella sp. 1224 TaxID=2587052 RepID=UPI0015CE5633|nr:rhamnogalacturonan acetylesterase [Duganella sp. 1224]NYE63615.1 lysophospholipase L1-like esterase [Duganella sp. 1224]
MKDLIFFAATLSLLGAAHAADAPSKPIRLILVGDSTLANTSGYGDAFCARVNRANTCLNLAKGGRSSGSFRAEGRWDEVEGLLRGSAAYRATYVLIQFGHNDQPGKPGRSTDLKTEFPANMTRYAKEVKALGGIPVLVTPLTRRTFKDGILENNLAPWADVIRATAAEEHVPLLDLNADSYAAVQAMGQDEADTLAMVPRPADYGAPQPPGKVEVAGAAKSAFDRTHLGARGAAFFSRMVMEELKRAVPELAAQFKPENEQ